MEDSYLSIFKTFLRFGFLAWGGPVAQIAMLREELVERRQWVTPDKFKRALAVYQALPGPEAHELCVYLGMVRKGRLGGFLAGLGFMLPGFGLILFLAWAYTLFGGDVILPFLMGFGPAVIALIVRGLDRIGRHTLTTFPSWVSAAVSVGLTFLEVDFWWIFLICALWQALWSKGSRHLAVALLGLTSTAAIILPAFFSGEEQGMIHGGGLLVEGLKAGLLSFGGAYTAIPFLKDSMVGVYFGVTQQAFLDGLALSNLIPAPLVIFGTFLGFLAEGFRGAGLVTLGIFLPAFSFTLIGHHYLEKVIENPALHSILDGIAAAVVGLLAVTALEIAAATLTGVFPALIFGIALTGFYLVRGKWAVPGVMLGCGLLVLTLRVLVFLWGG